MRRVWFKPESVRGVGGAVKLNEMIARRHGKPFSFSCPELEDILGLSYGIIVFQEQVDQLLQRFAGLSSGEAEDIREAIHKRRREEYGEKVREEIKAKIAANGFSKAVCDEVCELVCGFKGYGFAQGHALAFAEISVRSVYCQQNYPSEYFASLLDAQPAGYYGSCTLVNEARARGVAVLPVDVNLSENEFTVEDIEVPSPVVDEALLSKVSPERKVQFVVVGQLKPRVSSTPENRGGEAPRRAGGDRLIIPNGGIRVSLRQITGLSANLRSRIALERARDAFRSFPDFVARTKPEVDELRQLILCGAFDSLHPNRRALMWAIPSADRYLNALQTAGKKEPQSKLELEIFEPEIIEIEDFNEIEKAIHERRILDLDVRHHLVGFERERIASRGGISALDAESLENGRKAIVVGNPIRLRFPPTPSGKRVVFFDLEDETGLLNVTCFDAVYQRDGHAIVCSPYVTVIGIAQIRDGHLAFLAQRVFPYHPTILERIHETDCADSTQAGYFGWGKAPLPVATADFLVG